ncbi:MULTISPECIES: hypothetical protein [unclassified Mesorhizobium]|uniref:hypothetical protein n=1 Tax=unclassified Mesorhizobium TaxID=325217 RepID=UPI00112BAA9C|nr:MULTISPECIES: hypothetical protein [unclassified Mesorhizobium]TPJ43914.1 hypothetical protein FJ437_19765 [Mesorhizobium sp. B2-6-6]MCA0002246.1 hypothetical protein [Mesorhizobium sp. B264B2A]MCA0008947.1 hypothetical protein [Mesorhizobium sp. B264B1B]MCA0017056.1 hypothetical protein [Mesorhizobium sp. B264B1A]TPK60732.1 hypothetical protein FJ551_20720 [Mesorhizobium sp. B2-5-1]
MIAKQYDGIVLWPNREAPMGPPVDRAIAGLGAGIVSRTEYLPDDRLTALSISDHKPFTQSFAACLKVRQTLRPIEAFMQLVRDH